MKKLFALLLALVICLSFAACSSEPKELTVEEAYAQLVTYATDGDYLNGWRLAQSTAGLLEYEDAQAYYDYCQGMRAYAGGGFGDAYELLSTVPTILDAQKTLDAINSEIGHLNGYYVCDNKKGAYLHVVIKNGKVASSVIGYSAEEQTFLYEDKDFYQEIVRSEFTDGTTFYAVGSYTTLGDRKDIAYGISTFDDTTDIMLIKYETAKFDTFNGVYKRIGDAQ